MSLVRPAIYYWIFLLALLVYVITAYNSHGFYYADEHFQIIEFAKLKCDLNTIQDMPWEYKEQLRSTIQPLLCLLIFKFCNLVHITNPYNFGFVLRLLSAFFALFTIHYFIIYTAYLIHSEHAKIAYYLFSYFIWFIPFISVHFSSENMGGLCFLTSLTIFFNPFIQQKKNFFMGCLMGLSFLFRFQMIFAVLGLVLWLVLVGKISFKNVMHLLSGFLLVISIGILIDCWFYEKPVLTAWNYFYAFYDNTVNDDSSRFGTSPWYTYIDGLFRLPGYFMGGSFILAIIILIIKNPKNMFIWIVLPFFIIHCFIPHKEMRFLFPIIYLLPILLILAYEHIYTFLNRSVNYLFGLALIITNSIGLIVMGTTAGNSKMEIVKYIHDKYGEKPINLIQCTYTDVYDKHGGIIPYPEKQMSTIFIGNLCDINDSLFQPERENLLVTQKRNLLFKSCATLIPIKNFVLEKQSIFSWVEWLNERFYNGFDDLDVYVLYKKKY